MLKKGEKNRNKEQWQHIETRFSYSLPTSLARKLGFQNRRRKVSGWPKGLRCQTQGAQNGRRTCPSHILFMVALNFVLFWFGLLWPPSISYMCSTWSFFCQSCPLHSWAIYMLQKLKFEILNFGCYSPSRAGLSPSAYPQF